jgi:hypothetical protein
MGSFEDLFVLLRQRQLLSKISSFVISSIFSGVFSSSS